VGRFVLDRGHWLEMTNKSERFYADPKYHHWQLKPYTPSHYLFALPTYPGTWVHAIGFTIAIDETEVWRDETLVIPGWFGITLFAAIPTVWFWRKRKGKRGGCLNCGYNLTGNVSGVCPECGTPVDRKSSSAPPAR
jgi:hypothetical protein